MPATIETAMVLAAGLGTRMRPLTDRVPKPLVRLAGRTLLDHVLDRIVDAGIPRAIVNVHYLADEIERHLAARTRPAITISNERARLLDTGGGVAHALPTLGAGPFLIHNSDSVWLESAGRSQSAGNLARLAAAWDDARMDALLLLAPVAGSLGYDGAGDFDLARDGAPVRRAAGARAPYVFTGVSIGTRALFESGEHGAFSLNGPWDRALARGRLAAILLEGTWMHIGTSAALEEAEALIAQAGGSARHA